MNMISPSAWGARVNYDQWEDTPYAKDMIAVHWNGPPRDGYDDGPAAEAKILQGAENYHLDVKGWRGLAYGYGIGASGTVYRIRGRNNYGAHRGDADRDGISNNKEVIPVYFILGQGQLTTPAMWQALRDLRSWLLEQTWTTGVGNLPVVGHRDLTATTCPGDEIMGVLESGEWLQTSPPPSELAAWIADMKESYTWDQSGAVEVAYKMGGDDLAFKVGVGGDSIDGWLLLLIMDLQEKLNAKSS